MEKKNTFYLYQNIPDMLLSALSIIALAACVVESTRIDSNASDFAIIFLVLAAYPFLTLVFYCKLNIFKLFVLIFLKLIVSAVALFGISQISRALFAAKNLPEKFVKGGVGAACFYFAMKFLKK